MPFAYDCGFITCSLKQFREGLLVPVEDAGIVGEAVFVAEFAGQYAGPGWTRKGIGGVAIVKPHSLGSDSVHIRGFEKRPTIAGHSLGGVVVRHYEQNVGLLGLVPVVAAGCK